MVNCFSMPLQLVPVLLQYVSDVNWDADEIDADHSGTLEEDEVKAFLDRLEVKANYQEARVLFVRLDYAGNGTLSFSEFMDRINNFKKHGKDMEKMRSAARAKSKVSTA